MDPGTETDLKDRGYSTMELNNRNIYLKEDATAEDYKWVDDHIDHIDNKLQMPNRYLSHDSFYGLQVLLSVTASITQAFMYLSQFGEEELHSAKAEKDMSLEFTYSANEQDEEGHKINVSAVKEFPKWKDPTLSDSGSSWIKGITTMITSLKGLGTHAPVAVVNPRDVKGAKSYQLSSDLSGINAHGKVCPYRHELTQPDFGTIGDILSTHFRTLFGNTPEDQLENLSLVKKTAAEIRLTRLGSEIAHLYKCLEVAIKAQCGLRPCFTGSTYDGCILHGGSGATILLSNRVVTFDKEEIVRDEAARISIHVTSLKEISELFPISSRAAVLAVKSMVSLRRLCLSNAFTTDNTGKILGIARGLDFGNSHWQVTPERLRQAFRLISGADPVTDKTPISRAALFSKDMLRVGLSVFGENEVPSWNIPSGSLRKLTGKSPPTPPATTTKKNRLATGETDDGPWVMETRGTSLDKAVEEFHLMAQQGGYRSIPSGSAKRQKYKLYQSARMVVFWKDMQDAYTSVNAAFKAEDRDDSATIGKRSPGGLQGSPSPPKKKVKIDI